MAKKVTTEEFLEKLYIGNEHYRSEKFKVVELQKHPFVLVETKFGLCLPNRYDLIRGNMPNIKSAINKDEYCVKEFQYLRGFNYDYSLVEYRRQKDTVDILCEKHGIFQQSPDSHKKGHGCWKCAIQNQIIPPEEVKERLLLKPDDDKYIFEGVEKLTDYIQFTCSANHVYSQKIIDKLNGNGCPICASVVKALFFEKRKNKDLSNIHHFLYLLEIHTTFATFYKVGVTKNMKERLRDIRRDLKGELTQDIKVLFSEKMPILTAYTQEAYFIEFYKEFRYHHPTSFGGVTECFTIDIFKDYSNISNSFEDYNKINDRIMCEENGIDYEQQLFTKY